MIRISVGPTKAKSVNWKKVITDRILKRRCMMLLHSILDCHFCIYCCTAEVFFSADSLNIKMTLSQDWIQSLFKAIAYKSTQPESQPLSQDSCKNPLHKSIWTKIYQIQFWGLDLTCSIFFLANFLVMIIYFFTLLFRMSLFVPKKTMGRALLSGMISVFNFVLQQDFGKS